MPKWLEDLGTSAGSFISGIGSSALDWVWDEDTGINYENLVPLIGLIAASRADDSETIGDFMGLSPPTPTGYTGGIPITPILVNLYLMRSVIMNEITQEYCL